MLAVVAGFAVAAGVLDVVELSRQVAEERPGLAVLAGLIATTRVIVVFGTEWLWRTAPSRLS